MRASPKAGRLCLALVCLTACPADSTVRVHEGRFARGHACDLRQGTPSDTDCEVDGAVLTCEGQTYRFSDEVRRVSDLDAFSYVTFQNTPELHIIDRGQQRTVRQHEHFGTEPCGHYYFFLGRDHHLYAHSPQTRELRRIASGFAIDRGPEYTDVTNLQCLRCDATGRFLLVGATDDVYKLFLSELSF